MTAATSHYDRILIRRDARVMATDVSVRLAVSPGERASAERTADACMTWLREVDARLSRFRPESDLCRLNAAAGRWHPASDVLYACVERAIAAARASGGLFDPTLLPQLEAWGYDRDFSLIAHRETATLPESDARHAALARHETDARTVGAPHVVPAPAQDGTPPPARGEPHVAPAFALHTATAGTSLPPAPDTPGPESAQADFAANGHPGAVSTAGSLVTPPRPSHVPAPSHPRWRDIALDPANHRIRLPRGTRLDLGGIAKGWAADLAIERLCAAFPNALVNIGGDLRLRGGPRPGAGWTVGLHDPRATAADDDHPAPDLVALTLSRGGLATSGAARRWWLRGGVPAHHLLDPRTGAPARVWTAAHPGATTGPDGAPLIATATALAPDAARAEVAAKVALLRGYPACLRAVEDAWAAHGPLGAPDNADYGVALVLILADGRIVTSANLPDWLATWGADAAPLYLTLAGAPTATTFPTSIAMPTTPQDGRQ